MGTDVIATTRGALIRGTTTEDALGDEIEDNSEPAPVLSWAEARRNYLLNPSMDNGAQWVSSAASGSSVAVSETIGESGQPAKRQTFVTITPATFSIALYGSRNQPDMPLGVALSPVTIGIRARASKPCVAVLNVGFGSGSSTTGATTPYAIGTEESDRFVTVQPGTLGQRLNLRLAFARVWGSINGAFDVGDWIEYSNPLFTTEWDTPRFFTGDDGSNDEERFSWAGDRDNSNSIMETSTVVDPGGWADFPLSIIEKGVREFDQASQTWRTVRRLVGRCAANVPVIVGDRIKDLRDGKIYAVDGFTATPRGLSGRSSVTLNLRRTAP